MSYLNGALIAAEAHAISADLREWNTKRAHAIADRAERIGRLADSLTEPTQNGDELLSWEPELLWDPERWRKSDR